MAEPAEDVLRFIKNRIDTVPEIEALLLFWEQRPTPMTAKQLASRLYVPRGVGATVVRALERRSFIAQTGGGTQYAYDSAWEPDREFMTRVAETYRRHLIPLTRLIHSKASPAVLEFARAFAPKKDI